MATLRRYLPKITKIKEIPNTGNLRNDVYLYLHGLMELPKLIGADTIRGLIMEPMVWRAINVLIPQFIEQRSQKSENKMTTAMTAILKNAEIRGEITLEKLTPRIISLPLNLLQYELITKLEPVSDEVIAEIVDDIFMPLIHATQQ
ncbi:MAG: TetR/AcrR family transcriptional regulator C-terminal ligand-binding domain-containing protein [Tepidanaerobacteraceae bacterium]|jgi:hypothetical protein|nr:TetR/AcrR family transcriptional regulator C-terminal ligand-binding domain-containing protein [Tepidanaerobacteraceae bacterium]